MDREKEAREVETNIRKSEHWSNFGTLTSLVSTAAYFFENTFGKNLPRWLNIATLSAVGVGIMGVVASYYYKIKAARIALYSPAYVERRPFNMPPTAEAEPPVESKPAQSWVQKETEARQQPTAAVKSQ